MNNFYNFFELKAAVITAAHDEARASLDTLIELLVPIYGKISDIEIMTDEYYNDEQYSDTISGIKVHFADGLYCILTEEYLTFDNHDTEIFYEDINNDIYVEYESITNKLYHRLEYLTQPNPGKRIPKPD